MAEADARAVVVVDVDFDAATAVAEDVGGVAIKADVTSEVEIARAVEQATQAFGHIDLLCLNAGIAIEGGIEVPNQQWQRIWDVNVMSHVYGLRAALPAMIERSEGYVLHTASAAGLLTNLGAAPYSVTKHAVVALAEWAAITYGDAGVKFSCLCPMGVKTEMLEAAQGGVAQMLGTAAIGPGAVAEAAISGIEAEQFLILPHPEVAEMFALKASDHEKWMSGMRRLQSIVDEGDSAAGVERPSRAHRNRPTH